MNEVKPPKKSLLYYYAIVLLMVMLFNFLAMPWMAEHQIREVDYNTFVDMVEAGQVVIACGGGGIPVIRTEGNRLEGAAAVIDKDFAASKLAQQLDADCLIILTAVEKVAIHYGKPDVQWLSELTPDTAQSYIDAGEFAPGSMLPKVQAAVEFASSLQGRTALITLLEKAKEGIDGKTGTQIHL